MSFLLLRLDLLRAQSHGVAEEFPISSIGVSPRLLLCLKRPELPLGIKEGGGSFCLWSSIILEISALSPITCASPLSLSCAMDGRIVVHRENKRGGCGLALHVQSDDIDIDSNLDLGWEL